MKEHYKFDGYVPGAIGRIAEMHARYYHREWDFGLYFEAKVATDVSAFLSRFDESRDFFKTVTLKRRVEGSIAIDGLEAEEKGAHLRWFILSEKLRGRNIGNRFMAEAINFCQARDYGSVYLWTFEGLDAARHLYEKYGFELAESFQGNQWGTPVMEQKFVLRLNQ